MNPVLGRTAPFIGGLFLDTGFLKFDGPRFDGLFREAGSSIDILALFSKCPGAGHLTPFIKALQAEYPMVRFYEVGNRQLERYLLAHGFEPFDEVGTRGPNLQWTKPL